MDEKKNIGAKLYRLRKEHDLTQSELYDELQKIISKQEGTMPIEDDNGKRVICKIEKGAGLSLRNAIAYSEYFNISLDYIYLDKKHYKPEYEYIQKEFGLSDDALSKLEQLNKENKRAINMLNDLLSPSLSPIFMELLDALSEHSSIRTKTLVGQNPGNTFFTNYTPLVDQYLGNNNIEGYLKKPIMLKPEDFEYLSLFKISELSRRMADKLKDKGGI